VSTVTEANFGWLTGFTISPDDGHGRVVVSDASGPILRMSSQLGGVLDAAKVALDECGAGRSLGLEEVATRLGPPWTEASVREVLTTIGASPAVSRGSSTAILQFRRPFSLQLTLIDPTWLTGRLSWLTAPLRHPSTWRGLAACSVLSLLVAAWLVVDTGSALHGTMPISSYLWLVVAFYVGLFLHELSHAATLVAHGGVSRRVGFMLFYLAPAFFCDVSDAWRARPTERLRVALAGVASQGVLGLAAGVLSMATPRAVAAPLAAFALLDAIYLLANLVPFIKLDGYIALAGYWDEPNLRAHAMAAARDWLGSHVYGVGPARKTTASPGRVAYGLACLVTPWFVVVGAVVGSRYYLASLGAIGTWIELLLAGAVVVWFVVIVATHMSGIARSGAMSLRVLLVWLCALAIGAACFTSVPLPQGQRGGVVLSQDRADFVSTSKPPGGLVGARVTIQDPAFLAGRTRATATVVGDPRACTVSLSAVVPVDPSRLTLEGYCVPVRVNGTLAAGTWGAVLEAPSATIGARLVSLAHEALR